MVASSLWKDTVEVSYLFRIPPEHLFVQSYIYFSLCPTGRRPEGEPRPWGKDQISCSASDTLESSRRSLTPWLWRKMSHSLGALDFLYFSTRLGLSWCLVWALFAHMLTEPLRNVNVLFSLKRLVWMQSLSLLRCFHLLKGRHSCSNLISKTTDTLKRNF